MDNKAMFKIGYGLYVLTTKDGEKQNGCIVNTVMQVTSNPNRICVAVNKSNHTHNALMESKCFNVSIISEKATFDLFKHFGFQSGRDVDKFKEMNLTALPGKAVKAPRIAESPVSIECVVKECKELGTHDMFIAEVVAVSVDDKYMDEKGSFHLESADPIVYSHGTYFTMGEPIGKFGYSVEKPKRK